MKDHVDLFCWCGTRHIFVGQITKRKKKNGGKFRSEKRGGRCHGNYQFLLLSFFSARNKKLCRKRRNHFYYDVVVVVIPKTHLAKASRLDDSNTHRAQL